MPVKKVTRRVSSRKPRKKVASRMDHIDLKDTDIGVVHQSAPTHRGHHHSLHHPHVCCGMRKKWGHKLLMTLVGILLVYLIVFLGVLIRNKIQEYNFIGYSDRLERTIRVEGEGSVEVKPNVAHIRMGLISKADTVEQAQKDNSQKMNTLISQLKDMGIVDEDIKTENYNVYPLYDWLDDGRVLSGYTVSQNISVRIKDLRMTEKVISLAGSLEINDVGQLEYSVDNKEVYIEQARKKAFEQISKKIDSLTQSLGVQAVGIVSYDEYEDNNVMNNVGFATTVQREEKYNISPQIEPGVEKVHMNITVIFEIR